MIWNITLFYRDSIAKLILIADDKINFAINLKSHHQVQVNFNDAGEKYCRIFFQVILVSEHIYLCCDNDYGNGARKRAEQLYWVHVMELDILGLVCQIIMELISFVSNTWLKQSALAMIWYQIENTLQHCWSMSVNYDAQMPINKSSVCFSGFNVQLSMHWALICGNSFWSDALLGVLYAMRLLVKNGHQKHIMCYNEI